MYPLVLSIGDLRIYSYPLFLGIAWGVGYQVVRYLIDKLNFEFKHFNYFVLGLFVFSWIGAKLFFLLFSIVNNHTQYLSSSNFWLGGGFVFYGGLITGLLYILLYRCLVDKTLSLRQLIVFLPALSWGHAIGRIGCFLAGCCYGKTTDFILSVNLHNASRHPVQLYEAIVLILLGALIVRMIYKKINNVFIISTYLISYSLFRFILEFFRGDEIRGEFYNFSSSQMISLIILFATLLYVAIKKRSI